MTDILLQSLFVNFFGITMLLAASQKKMSLRHAVFLGAAVIAATAFALLLGFYSIDFYPRSLRFFVLPATALLASLVAARLMNVKKEDCAIVYYNTAVCGALVFYGQRVSSGVSALFIGAAAGIGFLLALITVYAIRSMYAGKKEYLSRDVAAEVLFLIGLVSLLISGIK
jgi:hypothetical protein